MKTRNELNNGPLAIAPPTWRKADRWNTPIPCMGNFTRLVALLGAAILVSGSLDAATEAQKEQAIDDGLAYLAGIQQGNGHWNSGDVYADTAATGAALLAFLEEGYQAGTDVVIGSTNYGDVVGRGLNYVFSQAQPVGITPQTYGNPDTNGNQQGVKFVLGGTNNRDTYVTGLVLPAIASTGTPNALVTTGALAGKTYQDVVQDTVDYFAYGQNDSGTGRGGWRYDANSSLSDNSTAQWPVIGMAFAEGNMGATVPQFVKDELKVWTNYIQVDDGTNSGYDGASGYDRPTNRNPAPNESKTGGLLVEQVFAGSPDPNDVKDALAYLNREWTDGIQGTWDGNFGHPYAMWSVYKGLESTIGLNDTSTITNLHTFDPTTMDLDPGDTWNWYEDYCEWLVDGQNPGGDWGGYSYWNAPLATAWNINILNATTVPHSTPDGGSTLILLLGSVIGVFGARRWRR